MFFNASVVYNSEVLKHFGTQILDMVQNVLNSPVQKYPRGQNVPIPSSLKNTPGNKMC